MIRFLLLSSALVSAPVAGQTVQQRVDKIILDANTGKNAMARVEAEAKRLKEQLTVVPPVVVTPPPVVIPTPGLASIASNFDTSKEYVPSWGDGKFPPSAAPDQVGAFRFICNPAHVAKSDPVVYPGQPNTGHLHQYFGNTLTDHNSTYETLRKTGNSTCNSPLNRSAYWMPAMLDGLGNVVRPDYIQIYYKRLPISNPLCDPAKSPRAVGICVDLPRGLKFVFGFDMVTGKIATGSASFNCVNINGAPNPGSHPDMATVAAKCLPGGKFEAHISAPPCWNGKDLDSINHRDHMSYASYGSWGYLKCPTTHPYVVPTFTLSAFYTVDAQLAKAGDGSLNGWHFSSDEMPGMAMRPGSTFHADWFGAWDDEAMQMWTDNCINKLLNCSGGDLGNGKQLKMFSGFSWTATPRLVPVPTT